MKIIATLPQLPPGHVWCRTDTSAWLDVHEDSVRDVRRACSLAGRDKIETGTPQAGSVLWDGREYVKYQPETT